jgi:hypothetical protein
MFCILNFRLSVSSSSVLFYVRSNKDPHQSLPTRRVAELRSFSSFRMVCLPPFIIPVQFILLELLRPAQRAELWTLLADVPLSVASHPSTSPSATPFAFLLPFHRDSIDTTTPPSNPAHVGISKLVTRSYVHPLSTAHDDARARADRELTILLANYLRIFF